MFNLSSNDSFSYFAKTISKINILQWAGLRHSIPDFLKGVYSSPLSTTPSFLIHNNIFDVTKKKSKDYYLLLVTEKAQPPNITHKWKSDFNLSDDNLREFFCYLTRSRLNCMSRLSSTKCFTIYFIQIKNYSKLFRTDDVCTFCEAEQETLYHILYQCSYSRRFWNDFESYWYLLTNQQVRPLLQNVIFGIISKQCPSTQLLNYFIIVGKLFLWDCRRNQIKPTIKGYQNKIANKYETESKIKKNDYFEKNGYLALA